MDQAIADKIDNFFSQFPQHIYRKGQMLIHAEEDPSGVFYLKDGLVKEYFLTKKGDEYIINLFKPNTFFPMSSVINNTHNRFNFEVVTDSKIFKAPKEKTLHFLKDNPDVLFNLLSRVYKGIDGVLLRMAYLMSGDAYERLITEILIQAKRFGKQTTKNGYTFSLSEKELAERTGLTRETVSREFKKLKKNNLAIFTQGTITIPDIEILQKELF